MVSFQLLGQMGGLGSQLFQYAFLRLTARRLGTTFYCPQWLGDQVFELSEGKERDLKPTDPTGVYFESVLNAGFQKSALEIVDNFDLHGYFRSFRYFASRNEILSWFRFRNEAVAKIKRRFEDFDFGSAVSIHVPFWDNSLAKFRYTMRPAYFETGLKRLSNAKKVLVISNNLAEARKLIEPLAPNALYSSGNEAYGEFLYLMSRCRFNIASNTSLSWWGAWLNQNESKRIFVPKEGPARPGYWISAADYWDPQWEPLKSLRFPADHLRFQNLLRKLNGPQKAKT